MIWPGRTKLCTGPSHPRPVYLPVTSEHWHFHKSGEYAGKPLARCKACTNWSKLQKKEGPHGLVTLTLPQLLLVRELVDRHGGTIPAAHAVGMSPTKLRAIITAAESVRVQKRTIQRLLAALVERRKHDRENGASKRYRKVLTYRAGQDARLKRDYGF